MKLPFLQAARKLSGYGVHVDEELTPEIRYIRKDKAIPLQALTGHEGSKRLRLKDFKTIVT
jgi:hypothetical protein